MPVTDTYVGKLCLSAVPGPDGRTLVFADGPLDVPVYRRGEHVVAAIKKLAVASYAPDSDKLLDALLDDINGVWDTYVVAPVTSLPPNGVAIRAQLLNRLREQV